MELELSTRGNNREIDVGCDGEEIIGFERLQKLILFGGKGSNEQH
jgi:hypothetical protein